MTGKEAEYKVAEFFAQRYGALVIQNKKGIDGNQPFDLTMITTDFTYCVDVKHCDIDTFSFSRVEENQENSMSYLYKNVKNINVRVGFIIVYNRKMYWYPYEIYRNHAFVLNKKSVKVQTLTCIGRLL